LEAQVAAASGSSAYGNPVAHGTDQIPTNSFNCFNSGVDGNEFLMAGGNLFNTWNNWYSNTMGAFDLAKESEGHQSMLHKEELKFNIDDHNRMGIASPQSVIGNSSIPCTDDLNSSFSLRLMDCSTDNVPVNHTVEEVIAFGGIPKPSSGVRSSTRLGNHIDGDMSQIDKAMKRAQMRDDPPNTGKMSIPKYSIVNIPESEIIHREQ
jgi:hypothetical protein